MDGVDVSEGRRLETLRVSGFSAEDAKAAGYSPLVMIAAGYTLQGLANPYLFDQLNGTLPAWVC